MSNTFVSEIDNQQYTHSNILIVVNTGQEGVDEIALRNLSRKPNLSVVQLSQEKCSRTISRDIENMEGAGGSNFFSSIDQEELFKIEQALTSEQAKQILGDSLNGILDESEEPAVLEYLTATDSGVEGDQDGEAEELVSSNVDLGLLQLITMDHCYSAAPFQQLAADFESVGISDVNEEITEEYEEPHEEQIESDSSHSSPRSEHKKGEGYSPPSPRRRSQRQVDKAEKEQLEKIRAENTELLRKEKVMKQQGDKVPSDSLSDAGSVSGSVSSAPKRRTRKSTTSSRPDSSASMLSFKPEEEEEVEPQEESRRNSGEESLDDLTSSDEKEDSEDEAPLSSMKKVAPQKKKTPSSPKPKPEPKKKVQKPKVEKPPPAPPTPEAPPPPKEGDMPTAIPESKLKTLRNLKEVEALSTGFIAVGARKAGPDVKAVIERLQMEPDKKNQHTPLTPNTDEKKYPKRERKIPAYLREMEVGPALFSTPDVIKPKGHKDEEKSPESPPKTKSDDKFRNKNHHSKDEKKSEKKPKKERKEAKKVGNESDEEKNPESGSESEGSWHSEDDPDKLWCICQRPHNNRFMICCDKCEEWFHGNCVGVTRALGKEMEDRGHEWVCPQCKKDVKKRARETADEAVRKHDEEKKKKQLDAAAIMASSPPAKQPKSQESRDIRSFMIGSKPKSDGMVLKPKTDEMVPKPKADAMVPGPKPKVDVSPKVVKCIIKTCKTPARSHSVYCSDACIIEHAQESLRLLESPAKFKGAGQANEMIIENLDSSLNPSDEEDIEISASPSQYEAKPTSTPTSQPQLKIIPIKPPTMTPSKPEPRRMMMLADPPPPPKKVPLRGDVRVPVFESQTGSLLKGVQAPRASELERFLQNNPSYEVFKSGESLQKFYGQKQIARARPSSPDYQPPKRQESQETPKREKMAKKVPSESKPPPKEVAKEEPVVNKGEQAIQQTRDAVKKFFVDALLARKAKASDIKISDEAVIKLSSTIEDELYNFFKDTGMKYKSRYRSLIFNIKDLKNEGLFRKILNGEIRPDKLVRMPPEELASKELAEWRERESKHQIDMILQTENELLAIGDRRLVKTHKGEEMIEKVESKDYNAVTQDEPIALDVTALHASHVFDLSCLLCTGRITEEEYSVKRDNELKDKKHSKSKSRDKKKHKRGQSHERRQSSSRDRSRSKHKEHKRHDEKRRERESESESGKDRKRNESESDRKRGRKDRESESDRDIKHRDKKEKECLELKTELVVKAEKKSGETDVGTSSKSDAHADRIKHESESSDGVKRESGQDRKRPESRGKREEADSASGKKAIEPSDSERRRESGKHGSGKRPESDKHSESEKRRKVDESGKSRDAEKYSVGKRDSSQKHGERRETAIDNYGETEKRHDSEKHYDSGRHSESDRDRKRHGEKDKKDEKPDRKKYRDSDSDRTRDRDSDRKHKSEKRHKHSRSPSLDRKTKASDEEFLVRSEETSQSESTGFDVGFEPDSTPIGEIFEVVEIPSFGSDDLVAYEPEATEVVSSTLFSPTQLDGEIPLPSSQVIPGTPDADKEPSSTIKTPDWDILSPLRQPVQVWKGSVTVSEHGKFHTVAFEVSSQCENLQREIKPNLGVVGRIRPQQVESYLNEVKKSASRDILVLRFTFCQPHDQRVYESVFKHLTEKDRYGVLGPLASKTIKDFYLIPLPSNKNVPDMLLPIEGPGFEEPRPDLLIGVIVRVKEKQKTPRVGRGASVDDGSDTLSPLSAGAERPHYNPAVNLRKEVHDHTGSTDQMAVAAKRARRDEHRQKRRIGEGGFEGSLNLSATGSTSSDGDVKLLEEINKQIELEKKQIMNLAAAEEELPGFSIPGLGGASDFSSFASSKGSLSFLSMSESKKPRLLNDMGDVDMRALQPVPLPDVAPVVATRQKDPRQRPVTIPQPTQSTGGSLRSLSDEELLRKAMEMEEPASGFAPVPPPTFEYFRAQPPPVSFVPPPAAYPYIHGLIDPADIPVPPPPPSIREKK